VPESKEAVVTIFVWMNDASNMSKFPWTGATLDESNT